MQVGALDTIRAIGSILSWSLLLIYLYYYTQALQQAAPKIMLRRDPSQLDRKAPPQVPQKSSTKESY